MTPRKYGDIVLMLQNMVDHCHHALQIYDENQRGLGGSALRQRLALHHALTVIGEAANRIPQSYQTDHPQVPWNRIIGMRNRLVHGYDKVRFDVVVQTIEDDIPALIPVLEAMLVEARKKPNQPLPGKEPE